MIRLITQTNVAEICSYLEITRQTLRNVEECKYTMSKDMEKKINQFYRVKSRKDRITKYWVLEIKKHINREEDIIMKLKDIQYRIDDIRESDLKSDIRRKIKDENKKKKLKYSAKLYFEILDNIEKIIEAIEKDKINDVKRYYLKPLIEDTVTLTNIRCYKKDAIKALDIQYLSEALQAMNYFENIYKNLGLRIDKLDEDLIKEKQINNYEKIKSKTIKDIMTNEKKKINYNPKFHEKLKIYTQDGDEFLDKSFIEGLYDYVNNYSHANLFLVGKVKDNEDKFIELIIDFIGNILRSATSDMKCIFKIKLNYIKDLYSPIEEDEDLYLSSNFNLDEDEDEDEDEFDI